MEGLEGTDPSLIFVEDQATVQVRLARLWGIAAPDRAIWICWPKKSSKLSRDLAEDGVRAGALPLDLVDVKVCAIDAE